MFTGIVQGVAEVLKVDESEGFRTHVIHLPDECLRQLETGASIAHNGCCLTVTKIDGNEVSFDLMHETLRVTNLGELQPGSQINVERAARIGDEIGGHQMSGHIMSTARVVERVEKPNNLQLEFSMDKKWMKYVFPKGFIGVDGISLTVGQVQGDHFMVNLIPETLRRTTIGNCKPGDRVNIEIDPQTQAIVDTVERLMADFTGFDKIDFSKNNEN